MSFECKPCNYITTDSSNYRKHLNSSKHNHLCHNKHEFKYNCEFCGKGYTHHSGYYRHIKLCEMENQGKNNLIKIMDNNHINDTAIVTNNNTVNIIKNNNIENDNIKTIIKNPKIIKKIKSSKKRDKKENIKEKQNDSTIIINSNEIPIKTINPITTITPNIFNSNILNNSISYLDLINKISILENEKETYRSKLHNVESERDNYKNKVIDLESEINTLLKENITNEKKLLFEKDKIMEKYMEQSSNNQEILQDEVFYLKSLCTGATKLVSETMNTVNFIINNFTIAPPIDKNIDYKQILYDNNKEKIDVIEDIVHHYKHKSLIKYIGDMIVKCYKKEDPSQQSIWNSDVSRKNYLLRELINKKPEWVPDKKGIKTIEIIINPILKIIEELIIEFLNQSDKNKDGSINKYVLEKKLNLGIDLNQILFSIEHKTLHNDINSYIAQFFYFNKIEFINKTKKDKPKKIRQKSKKELF